MDSPLASPAPLPSASRPRSSKRAPRQKRVSWRITRWDIAYAREMIVPILLGMMVLVLVLSANFVYWGINSVVNQGLGLAPVVRLFLLAVPGFSIQGVAVGVILGVCLVCARAVRDNEVTALRAGGASVFRILLPFWVVSVFASGFAWLLLEHIAPRTNSLAEKTLQKLMHTSAAQLIEGDKYFRVGQFYFYVQSSENKVLRNVMIYERNTGTFSAVADATFPTVWIAKEAREDTKKANRWILSDVIIHSYDARGAQRFEAHKDTVSIDVGQELSSFFAEAKSPFSMTGNELAQRINTLQNAAFDTREVRKMQVEFHRKRSLPAACFVMALLAAPLSLKFARHGSFAGLVCAFGLAFCYQAMDSFFRAIGFSGRLEPAVAAWSTNAIFVFLGALLLLRER
jgi:lipopolysaccharide export LptBFGC system permease protein LptF